jgi:hypothetical protein
VLEAVAREIDDLFGLVGEANNQQPIILGFRRLSAAIRKRLAAAEPPPLWEFLVEEGLW